MPDWPNVSTPSGTTGAPNTPPRKLRACEAPSGTVTIGAWRSPSRDERRRGGRRRSGRPWRMRVEPAAMLPVGQALGRRHDDEVGGDLLAVEQPGPRLDGLGHDRAGGHDLDRRGCRAAAARARPRPRAGGSRRPAPPRASRRAPSRASTGSARDWSIGRVDEPQVGGEAVAGGRDSRAMPSSSVQTDLAPEDRLVVAQARQLDAERRRDGRLVGAALRGERHARRRADEDELRLDVERVDERVEAARDERVVDGADRARGARRTARAVSPNWLSHMNRFISLMPELDVLAGRPRLPDEQALDVAAIGALVRARRRRRG